MEDIKEKSADEMFEELGYRRVNYCGIGVMATRHLEKDEICYEIGAGVYYILMTPEYVYKQTRSGFGCLINMQELKAINKKIEELGW